MLSIYNSLTRKKAPFKPLKDKHVGLYVCGMTVYDYCHLGHARSMVAFDMVVRYMQASGYQVNYVRNVTDIDDKIIKRAKENGEDFLSLTKRMVEAMHEDERALNILPPTSEPHATAHISDIIALIQRLLDKDIAYIGKRGDVYFDVSQFAAYGKLAQKDLDGQDSGARVEVADDKRAANDFVLWKPAKTGEPAWASPWGEGRPGWHIECSAMAMKCLGDTFDIHGGGFDLQFPHHENEIAQSEAATEKPFAKTWMHAGFLQVNKEKMSKSLNNFFTIRDVLKEHHPEVVRYFLLSSHYRSQLNYSEDNLRAAHSALSRLYQSIDGVNLTGDLHCDVHWRAKFDSVMDDDFNTPEAMAVLFELSHEINRLKLSDKPKAATLAFTLKELAKILGLLIHKPTKFLQAGLDESLNESITRLIEKRLQAKKDKDYALADALRAEAEALGVELLDTPTTTTWRVKRP